MSFATNAAAEPIEMSLDLDWIATDVFVMTYWLRKR